MEKEKIDFNNLKEGDIIQAHSLMVSSLVIMKKEHYCVILTDQRIELRTKREIEEWYKKL